MRLETLQKQVEDQQEHICVLRDSVSLKDRQADMLHSDVTPALTRTRSHFVCLFVYFIRQSTYRKRFTISQEKHDLKIVRIKWPTQGRATYV